MPQYLLSNQHLLSSLKRLIKVIKYYMHAEFFFKKYYYVMRLSKVKQTHAVYSSLPSLTIPRPKDDRVK